MNHIIVVHLYGNVSSGLTGLYSFVIKLGNVRLRPVWVVLLFRSVGKQCSPSFSSCGRQCQAGVF